MPSFDFEFSPPDKPLPNKLTLRIEFGDDAASIREALKILGSILETRVSPEEQTQFLEKLKAEAESYRPYPTGRHS